MNNFVTNHLFGWEICVVLQGRIFPHQDYEQVIFSTKNDVFISLVGPSGTGKSQSFFNWLKNGTF